MEISIEEGLTLNDECEIGDELLIEIKPTEFDRVAVQSAKQKAKQTLREIQKDTLHSEYKDKVGEMIIGYYQRERNGNIFVDLGKTEGILPKKYQSPRELYRPNDRIKALIFEVNKTAGGLQIVLSRTHADFVRRIFELEVPEIYDKTVEIFKIVREPGYRTKIAVYSNRDDVDPVGACVGMKGVRIQAIVREMEGEKVDILKYESDPRVFIKNALSPAEVLNVIVLDEAKRQALAIVGESQLSLAIGKQGLNVRLANRLVDWNIDVKTESQFDEMDIASQSKEAVSALFNELESDEITKITELPDIPARIVEILIENGIELIETLVSVGSDELLKIDGITDPDVAKIQEILSDNVQIVEDDGSENALDENDEGNEDSGEAEDDFEDESYECPECGDDITIDMSVCPSCGVGLSFEVEDDAEAEEKAEEKAEVENETEVKEE